VEVDELLQVVVTICERLQLRYFVTGSMASIAYGEPRFTKDIDMVLDITLERVDDFYQAFPESEYDLSRDAIVGAIRIQSQFNLMHNSSGLKVDFMICEPTEFNRSRMARWRELPVMETGKARFASPEDVILMKLKYFQIGESDKHLRDIRGMMRIQGDQLNLDCIAEWAERLSLVPQWQKVLEATDNS